MVNTMTKVIRDSLTQYQTNYKNTNEQKLLQVEETPGQEQKEAVIAKLSHVPRTVIELPQLTSTQADILSRKLAHNITLDPRQSLSAHRLTPESLTLVAD